MWTENLIEVIKSIEDKIKGGILLDVEDYENLIFAGHNVLQSFEGRGGYVELSNIVQKAKDG